MSKVSCIMVDDHSEFMDFCGEGNFNVEGLVGRTIFPYPGEEDINSDIFQFSILTRTGWVRGNSGDFVVKDEDGYLNLTEQLTESMVMNYDFIKKNKFEDDIVELETYEDKKHREIGKLLSWGIVIKWMLKNLDKRILYGIWIGIWIVFFILQFESITLTGWFFYILLFMGPFWKLVFKHYDDIEQYIVSALDKGKSFLQKLANTSAYLWKKIIDRVKNN